jgi:hypothetical protein
MSLAPLLPLAELEIVERPSWLRLPKWLNLNVVLQVLAAAFGLGGQVLINQQNPIGHLLWLGSNTALLWLQFRLRMFVLVALHAVYFSLCVHGFITWVQR